MTTNDYDPRLIDKYQEPRYLVHFQWDKSDDVYRYALVEVIHPKDIDSRNKEKKDEKGNNRKQILTYDGKTFENNLPDMEWKDGKVVE